MPGDRAFPYSGLKSDGERVLGYLSPFTLAKRNFSRDLVSTLKDLDVKDTSFVMEGGDNRPRTLYNVHRDGMESVNVFAENYLLEIF